MHEPGPNCLSQETFERIALVYWGDEDASVVDRVYHGSATTDDLWQLDDRLEAKVIEAEQDDDPQKLTIWQDARLELRRLYVF